MISIRTRPKVWPHPLAVVPLVRPVQVLESVPRLQAPLLPLRLLRPAVHWGLAGLQWELWPLLPPCSVWFCRESLLTSPESSIVLYLDQWIWLRHRKFYRVELMTCRSTFIPSSMLPRTCVLPSMAILSIPSSQWLRLPGSECIPCVYGHTFQVGKCSLICF